MSDPCVDLEKGLTGGREAGTKMSDPCVDLEKGLTGVKEEGKGVAGLKEEEKGINGLMEEERAVHQYKHLKFMCVKLIMDVYPVIFFVMAMVGALSFYRQTHIWLLLVVLPSLAIWNFWNCRNLKRAYIQHNALASADGDLSTTLLASSKK